MIPKMLSWGSDDTHITPGGTTSAMRLGEREEPH